MWTVEKHPFIHYHQISTTNRVLVWSSEYLESIWRTKKYLVLHWISNAMENKTSGCAVSVGPTLELFENHCLSLASIEDSADPTCP